MDNGAGCGIIVLVAAVVAGVAMWETHRRNKERAEVFSRLARRWNGRVTSDEFLSKPRLEINVEGVPGEVTFGSSGRRRSSWNGSHGKWTKVHLNWGTKRRLRVVPEGFTSWLRTVFGTGDLQVGNLQFDPAFWVETSDEAWARQVLGPQVQSGLLRLRGTDNFFSATEVTLDVGPSGVILRVYRLLVDHAEPLEAFVQLAALILEEARGIGAMASVVFAAVETKGGSCPVCGHVVEEGRTCPDCRTPHHEDCWKYSGGCAIFACAGRAVQVRRGP